MKESTTCRYISKLSRIAYSAANESNRIYTEIYRQNVFLNEGCVHTRRYRRQILRGIRTSAKRQPETKYYKIATKKRFCYPSKQYRYICQKLADLADRQSNILSLCRIYNISMFSLTDLFSGQALSFSLLAAYLTSNATEGMFSSIVKICRHTIACANKYRYTDSLPTNYRYLMKRDIADEFILIANGITEILLITLIVEKES